MFLADVIREKNSVEAGKAEAYSIELSDERLMFPDEIDGESRWNIPLVEPAPSTPVKVSTNADAYSSMHDAFPKLTVTFKYKREVKRPKTPCDAAEYDRLKGNDEFLLWETEDEVSQHDVGSNLVMSIASSNRVQSIAHCI